MISATILYRNAWGGRKVVTKDFVDRGHLDNYLNLQNPTKMKMNYLREKREITRDQDLFSSVLV